MKIDTPQLTEKIISMDEFFERYLKMPENTKRFSITGEIKKGDLIQKGLGFCYEIDDTSLGLELIPANGQFPYGPIYRAMDADMMKLWGVMQTEGQNKNGRTLLPFSTMYRKGLGECLEKSIVSQFCLQRLPGVEHKLMVSGTIKYDNADCLEGHAYNVIKKDGLWILVDTSNPHAVYTDGKTAPYMVKIEGVTPEGLFPVVLDKDSRNGRDYFLR